MTDAAETQPIEEELFFPQMTSITIVTLWVNRDKVVASEEKEIATTEFLLKQAEKALRMTLDQLEKEKMKSS